MLLAAEEQVFAMLAGALLKQTNRKKKRGEKKNKKTKTIPSSVWLFVKRKNTELHIHQHRENGCTVDHSLFFKLFIFPNEIFWKEVSFLEIHSSSIKSWKLRLPKICVLTCQPHLCAYVHTYAFVCTFLSQVQQGLVCFVFSCSIPGNRAGFECTVSCCFIICTKVTAKKQSQVGGQSAMTLWHLQLKQLFSLSYAACLAQGIRVISQ